MLLIINIDNDDFEQIVDKIYAKEFSYINQTTRISSEKGSPFLDLNIIVLI